MVLQSQNSYLEYNILQLFYQQEREILFITFQHIKIVIWNIILPYQPNNSFNMNSNLRKLSSSVNF